MARTLLQQERLYRLVERLTRRSFPDDILHEMSVLYEQYSAMSTTEAEVEFWLKTSLACRNLSGGTEKWYNEMLEEIEEEE